MKVLLAIGDAIYSSYLREDLERAGFDVINTEIIHIKYVDEVMKSEEPNILCLNDQRIGIDTKDLEQRDVAVLEEICKIRLEFPDLRIVLLTERDNDDEFLRKVVAWGVYDIFNNNRINMESFINQLREPTSFTNVHHILDYENLDLDLGDIPIEKREGDGEQEQPGENEEQVKEINKSSEKKKKQEPEKQPVQKVIEKKNYTLAFQKVVAETVGITIPRKTILVANVNNRAGSTFVSHLLCDFLNAHDIDVNYVENIYDEGYTFPRFKGHDDAPDGYRSYISYLRFQEDKHLQVPLQPPPVWIRKRTTLLIRNPLLEVETYEEKELDSIHLMKMIYAHQQSPITIVDAGSDWDKDAYKDILDMADYIFFVVEPDLVQMLRMAHGKTFKTKRLLNYLGFQNCYLIGNRFSPNLEKHPIIQESYGSKLAATFCDYFSEDVFASQMEYKTVYEQKKYHDEIEKEFQIIYKLLLPEQLQVPPKKNTGGFFSQFRFKKLEN